MQSHTRKIIFRPLQEKDFVLLHAWFQMEHVKKWYCRDRSYTLDMITKKYRPRLNEPDIKSYMFTVDDEPVGYYQTYQVSKHLPDGVEDYNHPIFKIYSPSNMAGIDFFIGNKAFLYSGIGSHSLNLLIKTYCHSFKILLSDPLYTNGYVVKFLIKNGFKDFNEINQHSSDNALMILPNS